MLKHLFFDLDRTLWDFEKNSEKALHNLFHELGLDRYIPEFREFHEIYKEKNAELWKSYGEHKISKEYLRTARFEVTLAAFHVHDPKITELLSQGYIDLSPRQTELFPEAINTLETLRSMGYSMDIITNGFKEVQYIKLENSGLAKYFNHVTCSEEIGMNKPAPDIFHYAAGKAGVKVSDSVMIGDDPEVDVVGALNAGMRAILFDPEDKYKQVQGAGKIGHLAELPECLPFI